MVGGGCIVRRGGSAGRPRPSRRLRPPRPSVARQPHLPWPRKRTRGWCHPTGTTNTTGRQEWISLSHCHTSTCLRSLGIRVTHASTGRRTRAFGEIDARCRSRITSHPKSARRTEVPPERTDGTSGIGGPALQAPYPPPAGAARAHHGHFLTADAHRLLPYARRLRCGPRLNPERAAPEHAPPATHVPFRGVETPACRSSAGITWSGPARARQSASPDARHAHPVARPSSAGRPRSAAVTRIGSTEPSSP